MNKMMRRGKVENSSAFFLVIPLCTRGDGVMHYRCEFFVTDNERYSYFIHNPLFRCKFTKFISFLGIFVWKSLVYG